MTQNAISAVEVPELYLAPIPSRARKEAVWKFAEGQREVVGLKDGFQLSQLVTNNGGRIEYINFLDDDQTDAIIVEPDSSFLIRLSSLTQPLRDNFTIAHELGHWLMHWPQVRKAASGHGMKATRSVDRSSEALIRCEWEANWFASAFLMPEDAFRRAYADGVASEMFGVSDAAVEVRAKSLGIR